MIKTVGIVSLSSGILGESFMKHELDLGLRRMEELGLRVKFMPNALRGADFLQKHPEARAADFIEAFRDPDIDLIMTAIGGDDTYRLLPYLFDSGDFAAAVRANPKPFLGFSDTTTNHLMLHRLGLPSYYGQAFITELCELDTEMLPYSRKCFEAFIETGRVADITPIPLWYESRTSFGPEELGVPAVSHPNGGFALLQGAPRFRGRILGGCIDTIFDYFDPLRKVRPLSPGRGLAGPHPAAGIERGKARPRKVPRGAPASQSAGRLQGRERRSHRQAPG